MAPPAKSPRDEDDDEPELEVDEPEPEENTDDEDKTETVVSSEEFARMQEALKKANNEAKKHRLKVRELKAKTESDNEKVVREAIEASTNKLYNQLKRSSIREHLTGLGVQRNAAERLVKLVDLDELDVTDSGEVLGVPDAVKSIRSDFPDLFKKKLRS